MKPLDFSNGDRHLRPDFADEQQFVAGRRIRDKLNDQKLSDKERAEAQMQEKLHSLSYF